MARADPESAVGSGSVGAAPPVEQWSSPDDRGARAERSGFPFVLRIDGGVPTAIHRIDHHWVAAFGGAFGVGLDRPVVAVTRWTTFGWFGRIGGEYVLSGKQDGLVTEWKAFDANGTLGLYIDGKLFSARTGLVAGGWEWMGLHPATTQAGATVGASLELSLEPVNTDDKDGPSFARRHPFSFGVFLRGTNAFYGLPTWSVVSGLDVRFGT